MRKSLATAFATLVLLTGVSSFLTACNTVEGAGKDVSKAGQAVSEEAKEHKSGFWRSVQSSSNTVTGAILT